MDDRLLLGIWRYLVPIPCAVWQRQVGSGFDLDFMTEAHHRVRNYVVREMPRIGEPISPERIAQELSLPLDQVLRILDELEQHMTFLFRSRGRDVTWAYPVTVDPTPHHVTLGMGERINAAWAIDAIAVPFVQGHLRGEGLSCVIETKCAHCQRPIQIEIDSELNYRVLDPEAEPLVHVPRVDAAKLDAPSIIDGFWKKSVFFWSEEHAREYRRRTRGERGIYMTLAQCAYVTPRTQGPLFAFPGYWVSAHILCQ